MTTRHAEASAASGPPAAGAAKIIRVIARLNIGGPAIHAILLTAGLNGDRFTTKLVTGRVGGFEGDMEYYARKMNVVPLVIPGLGQDVAPANDVQVLFRLLRLLWDEQPAILHTHTGKAGILGRLAAVLYNAGAFLVGRRRIKMVHTFHGHVFHGYFGPLSSRLLVIAERMLALVTDRIVTVSDSIKNDLVARYRICAAGKITIVPLGLDFRWVSALDAYRGRLRAKFDVPHSAVTLGVVGRLTAIKNHAMLVAAMDLLTQRDLRLFVIGEGELRPELERVVRDRGLSERVLFTGWREEPAEIYADLDVVCLTSRNEGTPVVMIEAMAAGKPIVATRVGGVADLMIGEPARHPDGFERFANGILVPSDDVRAFAAAVGYLAERPDVRRAMGSAGQTSAMSRFSRVRLVRDTKTLYTELLGGAGNGGVNSREK